MVWFISDHQYEYLQSISYACSCSLFAFLLLIVYTVFMFSSYHVKSHDRPMTSDSVETTFTCDSAPVLRKASPCSNKGDEAFKKTLCYYLIFCRTLQKCSKRVNISREIHICVRISSHVWLSSFQKVILHLYSMYEQYDYILFCEQMGI